MLTHVLLLHGELLSCYRSHHQLASFSVPQQDLKIEQHHSILNNNTDKRKHGNMIQTGLLAGSGAWYIGLALL